MPRRRTALHAAALWLTLAGIALRGLIPVGFMPGWVAAGEPGNGGWMVICPSSPLRLVQPVAKDRTPAGHLRAALQAMPADVVTGPICHGDARPTATATAATSTPTHDEHGAHGAHRLAAQHLDCPFALAVAAVLPAAGLVAVSPTGRDTRVAAGQTSTFQRAPQRRLPPARAPPAVFDTTFA